MRAIALAALLVGCYRESKPPPPQQPEPQPLVVEKPKHVRTAQDPLGFLPIDAEVVAHLDANQLRRSAIWARFEPTLTTKVGPTLDQFRIACGFDPVPMIRRVALAMKNIDAPHPDAVLVVRGIERDPTMRCIVQTIARDPSKLTLKMEDGVLVMPPATPSDTPLAMSFADSTTLVFMTGPASSKDTMRAVLDSGSPLRNSPAFVQMFGMIDAKKAAWFLINGNASFLKNAGMLGIKLKAVFGAFDLTSGIAANVRLRTSDPAEAQSFTTMAQGQLTAAKSFFERIDVTAEDADAVIDFALTDDQANNLINLINP